jgi:NADH-quinone oxidoreductase subunit N
VQYVGDLVTGALALESAVFGLLLIVVVLGIATRGGAGRAIGWLAFAGLTAITAGAFATDAGASAFGGGFVVDELALFAKRLFLSSAAVSALATLGWHSRLLPRRSMVYFAGLVASVVGMRVLSSARVLVTFFVALEVMSIPLECVGGGE